MDRIKLREYKPRGTRLFLLAVKDPSELESIKLEVKQAARGRTVAFDYEGATSEVQPFQARLWVDRAPNEGDNSGVGYMDYLNPSSSFGLDEVSSFESACKAFERENGYYPDRIL